MKYRPLVELAARLQSERWRIFSTADFLLLSGLKHAAGMQALKRLRQNGVAVSLRRGVWMNRLAEGVEAFEALPSLCAPWPAYVSLHSALSWRGLVEEVPQVIYGVTSGRSQRHSTPIGTFHIHHLPNRLIWGFEMVSQANSSFLMAEAEKAFLDLVYLGLIPRSPLGFPYQRDGRWRLDRSKLRRYAVRFKFPPLLRYLKKSELWK